MEALSGVTSSFGGGVVRSIIGVTPIITRSAVPALVFYKDRDGRFLRVNRELARLVGVPPEMFVGKTDAEASDYFKVAVKPGQRLTFEVLGRRLGSLLDPVVKLYDGGALLERD